MTDDLINPLVTHFENEINRRIGSKIVSGVEIRNMIDVLQDLFSEPKFPFEWRIIQVQSNINGTAISGCYIDKVNLNRKSLRLAYSGFYASIERYGNIVKIHIGSYILEIEIDKIEEIYVLFSKNLKDQEMISNLYAPVEGNNTMAIILNELNNGLRIFHYIIVTFYTKKISSRVKVALERHQNKKRKRHVEPIYYKEVINPEYVKIEEERKKRRKEKKRRKIHIEEIV